ncbi:hypothetical protein FZC84_02060 [Rossellomorea vietnamensis]|uniref:YtxH domain-containing protein n=1 Tax=Rossellomorea vietnamensis TaxID=218284 RepID=A0A5D4MHZ4_9BACI|nr:MULTISPECIES: hypothetical protein [Bacillaceae]TYS01460.1 hypothetical protein FZC84_02060 [Rossellomorea vietnamensis]
MRLSSTLILGAAAGAGLLMRKKENRDKLQNFMESTKQKWVNRNKTDFTVEKAGNPDPADVEDNTMVSEGAQTSVQYYNSITQ